MRCFCLFLRLERNVGGRYEREIEGKRKRDSAGFKERLLGDDMRNVGVTWDLWAQHEHGGEKKLGQCF